MRRARTLFVLLAGLGAGATAGYFTAKSTQHALTTTVVQVRTLAPKAPAAERLLITIHDARACLPAGDGYTGALYRPTDTFVLRSDSGRLLAIPDSDRLAHCSIVLRYSFSPTIGLFYVVDNTTLATETDAWGPFDPQHLSANDYRLQLPWPPSISGIPGA